MAVDIDPIFLSLVATIHTCRFPFWHWDQAPLDRTERIALRRFRTLQTIHVLCSLLDRNFGVILHHHNYLKFYQLPNSNLFTHRLLSFSREATSETYGPRVFFLIYLLCDLLFPCVYRSIKLKNTKIPCCNLFVL